MNLLFSHEPKMQKLDVSYRRVLVLRQSRSEVQVSINGFESQSASAIVCLYSPQKGQLEMVVVFHLLDSDELVVYRYNADISGAMQNVLEQADQFAESMGFQVDDLGFTQLPEETRQKLWERLPLVQGTKRQKVVEQSVGQTAIAEATEMLVQKKKVFIKNLGRMLGSM